MWRKSYKTWIILFKKDSETSNNTREKNKNMLLLSVPIMKKNHNRHSWDINNELTRKGTNTNKKQCEQYNLLK